MLTKIKQGVFYLIRLYVKNYITGNLGKVKEENGYLICYVDKKKLKKNNNHLSAYCLGIKERDKELAKVYDLDIKVYYVFENLEFDNNVTIFGYGNNSEILIKNCNFKYGLSTNIMGKCIIDNCSIASPYFLNLYAKNLFLKNMNINNSFILLGHDFQIDFSADESLTIDNCTIGRINDKSKVFLTSLQKINLSNSKIVAQTIKCSSKTLITDNSSLFNAKEKIEIEGEILNNINMISPTIKVKDKITNSRIQLINTLQKIKEKCININQTKVGEYEKYLNSISVKKILKK